MSLFHSELLSSGMCYTEAREQMIWVLWKKWDSHLDMCLSTPLVVAGEEGLQLSRSCDYLSGFQKKMDKADFPAFLPVLLQSSFTGQRVICSKIEWENYSQKQMHLIFQEGLDSASTCTLKQSSWTSHFKTPRLTYSIFLCWLSRGDSSHLCAESFVDTERDVQLSAWSLMTEDQIYQKIYIFPTPSVD